VQRVGDRLQVHHVVAEALDVLGEVGGELGYLLAPQRG
jgi:hypothetical protein